MAVTIGVKNIHPSKISQIEEVVDSLNKADELNGILKMGPVRKLYEQLKKALASAMRTCEFGLEKQHQHVLMDKCRVDGPAVRIIRSERTKDGMYEMDLEVMPVKVRFFFVFERPGGTSTFDWITKMKQRDSRFQIPEKFRERSDVLTFAPGSAYLGKLYHLLGLEAGSGDVFLDKLLVR